MVTTVRKDQVSRSRVARSLKLRMKNFDEFSRQQHTPSMPLLRAPPRCLKAALIPPRGP